MTHADDGASDAPLSRFGTRVVRAAASSARAIADTIVPPVCLACHTPLAAHDCLCATCWGQIDFIGHPLCDRLGLPLPFSTGPIMISAAAEAEPPDYARARAVARYDGTMQRLVHGFKYSDRHDGRRLFGRWLAAAGAELITDADLLVPVPLNRWRLLGRRFNQAAILANEVARLTALPCAQLALTRIKATPRQVGLTSVERRANVAGAFRVPVPARHTIKGRHILLIDDVITTGATCNSAARALLTGGAASVDVLALALVTHTVA
jgi:ComF family protein